MEETWEFAVMSEKVKVFISWSKPYSQKLAEAFSDWINKVVQSTEIFISSGDIETGTRWVMKLATELSENNVGVAFVTQENKHAPWIQFEAGAISKNQTEGQFIPILTDLTNVDLKSNPLKQFQGVQLDEKGLRKVVHAIAKRAEGIDYEKSKVDEIFDVWWPSLEKKFQNIAENSKSDDEVTINKDAVSLEDLEDSVSSLIGSISGLQKSITGLQIASDFKLDQIEERINDLRKTVEPKKKPVEKPESFIGFEDVERAFKKRFIPQEIEDFIARSEDIEDLKKISNLTETLSIERMKDLADKKMTRIKKANDSYKDPADNSHD